MAVGLEDGIVLARSTKEVYYKSIQAYVQKGFTLSHSPGVFSRGGFGVVLGPTVDDIHPALP